MDNIVCILFTAFMICAITAKTSVACSSVSRTSAVGPNNPPQKIPSVPSVADVVSRAESGIVNDKITLNFQQSSGPQNIVTQFTVGETVALSCTPETQLGDIAADYIWKHNKKMVYTDGNSGKFRYIVNSVDGVNFLYIHNITFYDAGTIECFKRCHNGSIDFCSKKEYTLRPRIRTAQDVFVVSPKDVTVPRSTPASFTCAAKLRCAPDSDLYFIWKYAGAFISVPLGHPLIPYRQPYSKEVGVVIASNISTANDDITYCQETFTLTIKLASDNGGTVECWVRSDIYSDEWFMQKAQLHVQ